MSKDCRGRACIHTHTQRGMPSPGGPPGRTDIPEAGAKKRQGELGSRQGDTGSLIEAAMGEGSSGAFGEVRESHWNAPTSDNPSESTAHDEHAPPILNSRSRLSF